jgi:hypothetical protein
MNTYKQDDYCKVVAQNGNGELIMLDYIFDDGDGFKGATGSIFRPVSVDEHDERYSIEGLKNHGYGDLWKSAVQEGQTEDSLDDWLQDVLDMDGVESVFDLSFSLQIEAEVNRLVKEGKLKPEYADREQYPFFEYVSSGRCFDKDDKYETVFEPELLKKIRAIET